MADLVIDHIVSDGTGKPRVRGSGVAVRVLAELHNIGWSAEKLADHMELTVAQVYAALSYYYDHKAEMDESIHAGQELSKNARSAEDFRLEIEARQKSKLE